MNNIIFEVNEPAILSTNDMYYHPVRKTKSGKYMSYFAPSSSLKKLQSFYKEILDDCITEKEIQDLKKFVNESKYNGIKLILEFGIPDNQILDYDSSNLVKSIEDCIVRKTSIDDSYHFSVQVEKMIFDHWVLKVKMIPYTIKEYVEV